MSSHLDVDICAHLNYNHIAFAAKLKIESLSSCCIYLARDVESSVSADLYSFLRLVCALYPHSYCLNHVIVSQSAGGGNWGYHCRVSSTLHFGTCSVGSLLFFTHFLLSMFTLVCVPFTSGITHFLDVSDIGTAISPMLLRSPFMG